MHTRWRLSGRGGRGSSKKEARIPRCLDIRPRFDSACSLSALSQVQSHVIRVESLPLVNISSLFSRAHAPCSPPAAERHIPIYTHVCICEHLECVHMFLLAVCISSCAAVCREPDNAILQGLACYRSHCRAGDNARLGWAAHAVPRERERDVLTGARGQF